MNSQIATTSEFPTLSQILSLFWNTTLLRLSSQLTTSYTNDASIHQEYPGCSKRPSAHATSQINNSTKRRHPVRQKGPLALQSAGLVITSQPKWWGWYRPEGYYLGMRNKIAFCYFLCGIKNNFYLQSDLSKTLTYRAVCVITWVVEM